MDDNRVLIIDDDPDICDLLVDICDKCNYEARCSTEPKVFQDLFQSFSPGVIILDLHLGDADGIELLRFLSDQHCHAKIILISGYDEKILSVARRLGSSHGLRMVALIQKPLKLQEMMGLLEEIKLDVETPTTEQLSDAIDNNEIILHYQPKISLANNQIIGAEALARWDWGQEKLIMPDIFIAKAEESNLIKKITNSIVEIAFQSFHELNKNNPNIILSINLSGKDLDDLELPNKIGILAKNYEINPAQICFEVTESAVMAQPRIVMEVLTRLRLKGFLLSIDDFGTGYSSLVELRKMPFNEIKVDRSFVFELDHNKEDQIITRTIIELGHNLGFTITAEGVENLGAIELLNQYKCDVAQGYFYSQPLPLEQFITWMNSY